MTRCLLFRRDFRGYTGGHGKVWDYFNHANAHPDWSSSVFLEAGSTDTENPWSQASAVRVASWEPARASALFLAGHDWQAYPVDDPARPVINLVQGMRHADRDNPLHGYLSRRAVRICVSQPVADAINGSGEVRGPVIVIPAALDLAALPTPMPGPARSGVLIAASKQPGLGAALASVLRDRGHRVELSEHMQPRSAFLDALARHRVAVLLPLPGEGFYLPALEAMALGCATVVPDCIGNRQYLRAGENALVPAMELAALVAAVESVDDARAASLASAGRATASVFGLESERRAFHGVLDQLEHLWAA